VGNIKADDADQAVQIISTILDQKRENVVSIDFVSEIDGLFRIRVQMKDAVVMQEAAREI
jgi:hypothetical protein